MEIEDKERYSIWGTSSVAPEAALAPWSGTSNGYSACNALDLQASHSFDGGLDAPLTGGLVLGDSSRWAMQAHSNAFLDASSENFGGVGMHWQQAKPSSSPPVLRLSDRIQRQGELSESSQARSQRFTPKKRDLLSQYSRHDGPIVTLMICNIPCRITQQQLVDVINGMGFRGTYDFLYLPTGGRSSSVGSSNLGYGFINFMDPATADPFTQAFTHYQFEGTSSTKVCNVRPAHIQGLENNIHHFDRTSAKGRPGREGPLIRPSQKKGPPEASLACEEPSAQSRHIEESVPRSKQLEELFWLAPSYFDFLEDKPDCIVGCA